MPVQTIIIIISLTKGKSLRKVLFTLFCERNKSEKVQVPKKVRFLKSLEFTILTDNQHTNKPPKH